MVVEHLEVVIGYMAHEWILGGAMLWGIRKHCNETNE
jgi:hypothetical protein